MGPYLVMGTVGKHHGAFTVQASRLATQVLFEIAVGAEEEIGRKKAMPDVPPFSWILRSHLFI
jgi:hypothetical protein